MKHFYNFSASTCSMSSNFKAIQRYTNTVTVTDTESDTYTNSNTYSYTYTD